MAIGVGKVLAVGTNDEIKRLAAPQPEWPPGKLFSTMNAVMPRSRSCGSVLA